MTQFKVLSCGSNGNFQLGLGDDEDRDELQEVKFSIGGIAVSQVDIRPKQIICGGNHTFILFDNNELYSCGDNRRGQCGHSSKEWPIVEKFKKVPGDNWVHVGCGWESSILVNDKQEVFVCGFGGKGELGLGNHLLETDLKKLELEFPGEIIDLRTSVSHTIVRLDDNRLFGWGNSRKGQLGKQEINIKTKRARPVVWTPEPLDFEIGSFEKYALGKDFTVFTNGEEVRVFGKLNEAYIQPNLENIKTMWSSFHILYKDEHGNLAVRSEGNNSHGQIYSKSNVTIETYQIGSEHGLVLDDRNQVHAWGWGEHGNCGPLPKEYANEQDQVTFSSLNQIYRENYKVVMLGCGCATTWVVIQIS